MDATANHVMRQLFSKVFICKVALKFRDRTHHRVFRRSYGSRIVYFKVTARFWSVSRKRRSCTSQVWTPYWFYPLHFQFFTGSKLSSKLPYLHHDQLHFSTFLPLFSSLNIRISDLSDLQPPSSTFMPFFSSCRMKSEILSRNKRETNMFWPEECHVMSCQETKREAFRVSRRCLRPFGKQLYVRSPAN